MKPLGKDGTEKRKKDTDFKSKRKIHSVGNREANNFPSLTNYVVELKWSVKATFRVPPKL